MTAAGNRATAQRIVNAQQAFIASVREQFGLTETEAKAAWNALRKLKLVRIDAVNGTWHIKDGRFWERAVLKRAAGTQKNPRYLFVHHDEIVPTAQYERWLERRQREKRMRAAQQTIRDGRLTTRTFRKPRANPRFIFEHVNQIPVTLRHLRWLAQQATERAGDATTQIIRKRNPRRRRAASKRRARR